MAERLESFSNHGRGERCAAAGYITIHVDGDGAGCVIGAHTLSSRDVVPEAKNKRVNVLLAFETELFHDDGLRFLDVGLPLVDRVLLPIERLLHGEREDAVDLLQARGAKVSARVILFRDLLDRQDVNLAAHGVHISFVVAVRYQVIYAVRIHELHHLRRESLG